LSAHARVPRRTDSEWGLGLSRVVPLDMNSSYFIRIWISRACVFAKHSDWRSQRVFRCDRGVERGNRKICGIFFLQVSRHTDPWHCLFCHAKVNLRWGLYYMKKWNHCKSSYCAYTLEYVVIFAHVEQLAYRLSPGENFVNFWALVFSRRRPAVITGLGRDTDRKSRSKNTSTQNFEVLTWILACICTLMLWIICLNAPLNYLMVFVLSHFGCREFWEIGQFRAATRWQNEP